MELTTAFQKYSVSGHMHYGLHGLRRLAHFIYRGNNSRHVVESGLGLDAIHESSVAHWPTKFWNLLINDYTEQSHFLDSGSASAIQKISGILRKQTALFFSYKNQSFFSFNLSQINSVDHHPSYVLITILILYSHLNVGFPTVSFLQASPPKFSTHFSKFLILFLVFFLINYVPGLGDRVNWYVHYTIAITSPFRSLVKEWQAIKVLCTLT